LDDSAADGDLLFFRYDVDEKVVYHAMILIRKLPGSRGGDRDDNDNDEEEEPDGLLVYHTGPEGSQTGEVRKLRISTLNRHPDDIWHVKPGNPHFLGFFRLNILEFNLVSLSVNRSSQDSRNLALREGFFQRGFYLNGGRIK